MQGASREIRHVSALGALLRILHPRPAPYRCCQQNGSCIIPLMFRVSTMRSNFVRPLPPSGERSFGAGWKFAAARAF